MAKSNIRFLGRVSDEKLVGYYANCRGFVFPQEEDFGIVAIEAIASGKPVIAYRGGDIVRHIRDGREGVFFDTQTPEALAEAVRRFEDCSFDAKSIREYAQRFDKRMFQEKVLEYIDCAREGTFNNLMQHPSSQRIPHRESSLQIFSSDGS